MVFCFSLSISVFISCATGVSGFRFIQEKILVSNHHIGLLIVFIVCCDAGVVGFVFSFTLSATTVGLLNIFVRKSNAHIFYRRNKYLYTKYTTNPH